MKTKSIKLLSMGNLTGRKADDRFLVKTINDSVKYLPGQTILRPEAEALASSAQWKVLIVGLEEKA